MLKRKEPQPTQWKLWPGNGILRRSIRHRLTSEQCSEEGPAVNRRQGEGECSGTSLICSGGRTAEKGLVKSVTEMVGACVCHRLITVCMLHMLLRTSVPTNACTHTHTHHTHTDRGNTSHLTPYICTEISDFKPSHCVKVDLASWSAAGHMHYGWVQGYEPN